MTEENRVLYSLLKSALSTQESHPLPAPFSAETINWQRLFHLAEDHGVSPLLYDQLRRWADLPAALQLPPPILAQFKKSYIHHIVKSKGTQSVLAHVLRFAQAHEIPIMLLKGAAYGATVYEQPWYTISADVDLLVGKREDELAGGKAQAIKNHLDAFNAQQVEFSLNLEYEFYEHHDLTMNGVLPVDWARVWADARPISYLGSLAHVMSAEDMLLAATINACRKRYLRLRSIFDIGAILHRFPSLDWSKVRDKALSYRCNTISYAALMMADKTIGLRLPEHLEELLEIRPARRTLLEQAMRLILTHQPLSLMAEEERKTLWNRRLSWTLLLTYLSYSPDLLWPKVSHTLQDRHRKVAVHPLANKMPHLPS